MASQRLSTATRAPSLTARGRLVLVTAATLSVAGAALGVWALIALGLVTGALLGAAVLAFYPTALQVWRRHVELSWRLGRGARAGLVAGHPFSVEITLRNRAPIACGWARLEILASTALRLQPPLPDAGAEARWTCWLGARDAAELRCAGRALVPGYWALHGVSVELGDRFGVAALRAYFASPLEVRVLPRALGRTRLQTTLPSGASDQRAGRHPLRLRGMGGELRELRDHMPGDPFKQIAWKATARAGRLMVRELDREARVVHHVLVDIAASMRAVSPSGLERSKLAHAIEIAAGYARSALAAGERVGLITYDGAVHRQLRPDDRATAWGAIAERLMEAMHPVEPEFTELTDGELVSTVARYLRHQEAVETRLAVPPPIDDPRWTHVATGPSGELYDLISLGAAVDRSLARAPRRLVPEGALLGDRLRAFCRLRSIELPYRRTTDLRRRASGLAAALEQCVRSRGPQRIVILSDLVGLDGPLGPLERVAQLVRRRGLRPLCLVPSTLAFAQPPEGRDQARADLAAEIFGWEEQRREAHARRNLERLGVTVVPIGPRDAVGALLARHLKG